MFRLGLGIDVLDVLDVLDVQARDRCVRCSRARARCVRCSG